MLHPDRFIYPQINVVGSFDDDVSNGIFGHADNEEIRLICLAAAKILAYVISGRNCSLR